MRPDAISVTAMIQLFRGQSGLPESSELRAVSVVPRSSSSFFAITRREVLRIAAALPLLTVPFEGGAAMAEEPSAAARPLAYRGEHQPKPLPFDPTKITGMSEKLITSHHQNNYGGAVKRLNLIEQQIGALPKDAQPYQMGSLKREELIATNSMLLHETYF